MRSKYKILVTEHDVHDLELIDHELKTGDFDFVSEVVKDESNFIKALKNFIPDVILCDYSFPSFDGQAAFKIREEIAPQTPFILVSGTIGEEKSVELIKNGVTDFVLKEKLFTLNTKLARALKEAKEQKEKAATDTALKEMAARLAQAQKLAKLGSWDYDLTSGKLAWSEELYNVFDTDRNSFTETYCSFLHLVDENDRSKAEKTSRHSRKTGVPFIIDYGITTQKGEKRVIQEHGHCVKDAAGKVTRIFGTAQDITAIKKSEAAIIKAYEEKTAVLESIGDGFFATDNDSLVTYWNRKAAVLLDVKKEDMLGKNLHEMFAGSKSAVFYDNYQKAIREKTTIHFEGFSTRANKWFGVSAFASDNGLSVYFKDVTDKKKDEDKLRASEQRYRQIVETAQEGIWLIDEENKTTFVNRKMSQILEYPELEMIGRTTSSFKKTDEQNEAIDKIESRKGGKGEIHESKFVTKSGRLIWTKVSTNPMFKDDGSYAGALAMITDITEKKKAEQEMNWLINNTEESFILVNTNLSIISFNNQFQQLYSRYFNVAVVKGDSILNYVQPERIIPVKQIYERVLTGAQEVGEINVPLPGNAVKTFELKYKPARDEDGKIIGVFVSAIDVTEKKRSEEQLIIQEKRYRALVENGADAIVIVSPEGSLSYASPTAEKILGYAEEELMQLDLFSLIHPDDRAGVDKVWQQVIESPGKAIPGHTSRMLHKEGGWRWLEATVTNRLHDPALNGIVDNFRDVTVKIEGEQLREFERRDKEALINTTTDFMWSVTSDFKLIAANEAFINYMKNFDSRTLTPGVELLLKEIFPADYLAMWQELYNGALRGESVVKEMHSPAVNKRPEQWFETTIDPIYNNNIVTGIACYSRDTTARRQSEIQLNELNKNLQQRAKELAISNLELEQFAYVASHDLQEPLRMITSFLSQLDKKYGAVIDDKGKQYIHFAVDGAKRMRQIILDLLEFSRVGRTEDKQEVIDLNELVDEMKILYRKQMQEKNAVIISDILPMVSGNRSPIRQVFQNLISNALKFIGKDKAAQVNVTCITFPNHWQFAVRDNGIGIAREYFEKIFIIFQRLHNKDEFSGTGMGLSVTKKILENHGGTIWVESEEGKGSTFYFTLSKN